MTKEDLLGLIDPKVMLERSRNEIIFVTKQGKVMYMNAQAKKIRGIYTEEEAAEVQLEDLYTDACVDKLKNALLEAESKEAVFLRLMITENEDRPLYIIDNRVTACIHPEKGTLGYLLVGHDVTSEVNVRRELVNSRNYYSAIIENAIDGIIAIDHRGVIQSVNPAAAKLFGYEVFEMPGRDVSILTSEPRRTLLKSYLKNAEPELVSYSCDKGKEIVGIKKDGSTFPCLLSGNEIRFNGEIYYAGIVRDLTAEKEAEEKLKRLNRELEQRVKERTEELAETVKKLLNEVQERKAAQEQLIASEKEVKKALLKEKELSNLKNRFLTTAGHEFRTPLSAIKLSADLAEKYSDGTGMSEKRQKHLGRIKANVDNLTNILTDFMSLSRIREGKLEVKYSDINLPSFFQKVVKETEAYQKEKQNITYRHVGQEMINSDVQLLKNITTNLVSNAVKYSGVDGSIFIKSQVNKQKIIISIEDNGIGIPEKDHKHLFERFFRASNVSNVQGTGLGLNIVSQYVDLLGGEIKMQTKEGIGTMFKISLPVRKLEVSPKETLNTL